MNSFYNLAVNPVLDLCGRLWANALLYSYAVLSSITSTTLLGSFYNLSLNPALDLCGRLWTNALLSSCAIFREAPLRPAFCFPGFRVMPSYRPADLACILRARRSAAQPWFLSTSARSLQDLRTFCVDFAFDVALAFAFAFAVAFAFASAFGFGFGLWFSFCVCFCLCFCWYFSFCVCS